MADQLITAGDSDASQNDLEADVQEEVRRTLPEGFHIHSSETAAWVVRRIVAARQYAERTKLWAELERRRAEHEEQHLLHVFGGQLREWATREIANTKGRRRSVALPGGTVGFRSVPSRVVVRNDEQVIEWARTACPEAIAVTERLLKTPVSEYVEKTGEVPAGVEVTAPGEVFFVR